MVIRGIDPILLERLTSSKEKITEKDKEFKKLFDLKLSELNPATLCDPIDNRKKVLDHSDTLLNLLDDYGRLLSDPSKTSLDIEPVVARIEKEVERIEAETADRNPNDKDLLRLIDDLAVVAGLAVFRYHRGDFR
jgi:hypothetical protein